MAKSTTGKAFTDHPLMDEICDACKTILKYITIKNDVFAANSETSTSLDDAEQFLIYTKNGYIPFDIINFTYDMLIEYGYSDAEARLYIKNRNNIPESDREDLTVFANNYFITHFEEKNNYYRALMGLPPYNTRDTYYIYIPDPNNLSDSNRLKFPHLVVPEDYTEPIDYSIPIHEQPEELLAMLYYEGIMQTVRENECKGSSYSYADHLGPRSIDLYTARKAKKWDILYMPTVYYMIKDRFLDLYKVNRELYLTKSYQEFFQQSGDYYDESMILILLAQTFADMITDTPEWYIRRDIFDIRSCKYFLEAAGVDYFREIPLRYQIRIVKNLNKLIKYKSSNQNIYDILDIFNKPNATVYKYWLYKKLTFVDPDDEPEILPPPELEFIQSKIDDSYDSYIKDKLYRTPYDDITLQDKYWDAENDHAYVKEKILEQPFTIQGTKYMSIEYENSFENFNYQMSYALGLILDNSIYEGMNSIRIPVNSISEFVDFSIPDLFLLLVVTSLSFNKKSIDEGSETEIRVPEITIGDLPTIQNEDPHIMDWKVKTFPEIFKLDTGRIYGFNDKFDLDSVVEVLKGRHSNRLTRFGMPDVEDGPIQTRDEYRATRAEDWINQMRIREFIVPDNSITSIEKFKEVYYNNTELYHHIGELIKNAENEDDQKVYKYVFNELFTKEFEEYVLSTGETATDLIAVLKDRDYILYREFINLFNENNIDNRQDAMRELLNDIIGTLEYYINGEGLDLLFAFTTTESFDAIVYYLYLMIGFFKSYKVYFLDPYYSMKAQDAYLENSGKGIDVIKEMSERKWVVDKQYASDKIPALNEEIPLYEYDPMLLTREYADIYSYYDPDPLMDLDIDGLNASRGETEELTQVNGGAGDDSAYRPYTTLNGGNANQGYIDNILDGGDAFDHYERYHDIDGGYAYHEQDFHTDKYGSEMFNYMIDGGAAGSREFMNNAMHFRIEGIDLYADLIISNRDECIMINDDGIWMSEATFGTHAELDYFTSESQRIYDMVFSGSEGLSHVIRMLTDPDYRRQEYIRVMGTVIGDMEYAVAMMRDGAMQNKLENFVDSMNQALSEEFRNANPYAWEELY